jgi:fimbrial isopeptide formation D2 family protein
LTIGSDPADYVITDTMQTSFTYKSLDSISCSGTPLTSADYTLVQKDNVLTFSFDNTWLASQQEGDIITIQYSAILNNTATLDGLSAGNSNTAVLTHSAGSVSSKVTVWTYEAQIVKTDTENTVISGAVFEISQNGNTLSFVDEGNNTYKLSDGTESSTVSQITGGVITLQGLGAGTYSLTEIQAPSGYNKLTSPQTFEMSTRNNWAQVTKTDSDTIYNSGGIHVVNNTGIVLPETGGPGNAAILCTALGLFVCGVWLVRHDRS